MKTWVFPLAHIKDSRSYHFSQHRIHRDNVMMFATVAAVALHAGLIFGLSFEDRASPTAAVQEVTTVLTENLQKNEKADFIANASQEGGGDSDEKKRFENNTMSPLESETVNPTDDILTQEQKNREQRYQESYLRTTLSWDKVNKENDNKKDDKTNELEAKEQRLRQQIATLETKIGTSRQLLAKKSAIQIVSGNSTTRGETAEYIENFRQHVYRVGNQNYPQEARAKGLKGDVVLMVSIEPSGQIKAIKVVHSSGSEILDKAAKESVRKAAPFGAFNEDMKDYSEIRIIRTWRYGEALDVEAE